VKKSTKKNVVLGLVTGGMDMNLYIQAEDAILNRFCVPIQVMSRQLRLIIIKPSIIPIITAALPPTIQIPLALSILYSRQIRA